MIVEWSLWAMTALGLFAAGYGVGRRSPGSTAPQAATPAPPVPLLGQSAGRDDREWRDLGDNTLLLLPVLNAQMQHVIWRTECEAVELSAGIQQLGQADAEGSPSSLSQVGSELNQIVMALQCQDRTRQQLEHVIEALRHLHGLIESLMKGDAVGRLHSPRILVERLESTFTMAEERDITARVLRGEAAGPGATPPKPAECVTLF